VPGAWFTGPKGRIRIRAARRGEAASHSAPGRYLGLDSQGGMRISTGAGEIILDEVQPAGGKAMSARAFLNGNPLSVGSAIGVAGA
jgi:methionyl-tRNA formyltransferase